jgi:hypothetical protein
MGISAKFAMLLIFAFFILCSKPQKAAGNENCGETQASEWTAEKPEQHCRENATFADPGTALAEFEPILIDP